MDKEEGDNGVGDVNEYELVLNDDNHSASFRPVPSGSSVTDEDMYEGIVVVSGGLCSCMPRRGNAPPLPHTLAAHSTHRASPHLAPGVLPSSCFTARGRQLDGRDDGVRCVDEAGMPSRLSLTSVVYDTIVNGSSGGVDSGLYCCVGVAANSSAAAGQPFAPSAGGDVREPVTGGPVNPVTLGELLSTALDLPILPSNGFHLICLIAHIMSLYLIIVLLLLLYTLMFLGVLFLALCFSPPCTMSLCLPLLIIIIIDSIKHHSLANDLQPQMSAPPDKISGIFFPDAMSWMLVFNAFLWASSNAPCVSSCFPCVSGYVSRVSVMSHT